MENIMEKNVEKIMDLTNVVEVEERSELEFTVLA